MKHHREGRMNVINKKYCSLSVYSEEFKNARPFPFIVLDDFLDKDYFRELVNSYSNDKIIDAGKEFNTNVENEKCISLNVNLPKYIISIVDTLNSEYWVDNIKSLTGIDSLVSTNIGNTKLANYHEMHSNGFLASHVDHSYELETGLPHVLNIIIYLSQEWNVEDGGATLFYNKNGKKIITKVEYKPNRAVIFLHTPYSFHCVERIKKEKSLLRKSVYVDYYSESFDPYVNFKLCFPNKWFKHNTVFKLNSICDYFKWKNRKYTSSYIKYIVNKYKYKK
jgi:hypothetical protein